MCVKSISLHVSFFPTSWAERPMTLLHPSPTQQYDAPTVAPEMAVHQLHQLFSPLLPPSLALRRPGTTGTSGEPAATSRRTPHGTCGRSSAAPSPPPPPPPHLGRRSTPRNRSSRRRLFGRRTRGGRRWRRDRARASAGHASGRRVPIPGSGCSG